LALCHIHSVCRLPGAEPATHSSTDPTPRSAFATQQVSLRKCQDVMHIIISRQDWWATCAHILLQWHMAIGSMHSVSCSKALQGHIMCCGHAGLMPSTRDAARQTPPAGIMPTCSTPSSQKKDSALLQTSRTLFSQYSQCKPGAALVTL
jgi:hypothetical protein